MKRLILSFTILLSCSYCTGHQYRSLEDEIQDIMAEYHAIGSSVVVVRDNKIIYTHTFGYNPDYNDMSHRNAIPDDGIFWLASISKTFISTAIMQLVEKNMLKLDDDVNKYLKFIVRNPRYPDVPITIRMLLCHRSSINDKHYGWTLKMMDSKIYERYKECFNTYCPGYKYHYSNLNYNLLGAIIEEIMGIRFDQYIDEYICTPLGLNASFNLTKMDSTRLVRTLKYDKRKHGFIKDFSIFNYQYIEDKVKDYKLGWSTASLSPAGGMRITVTDLAIWMMAHMNYGSFNGNRILKKDTELAMWEPQTHDINYGFAFSHYNKIVNGEDFIGMTGGSHGINSVMFFDPVKKCGFVVITNGYIPISGKGRLSSLARELVRPLYKHFIQDK